MSVANHINTGTHCGHLQISPSPVKEINKLFRCIQHYKGEQDETVVIPPQEKPNGEGGFSRLSEKEEITPKKSATKSSLSPQRRISKPVFVRLAEESPKRNFEEFSDSSTYDSVNLCETDVCHDSTDTDSNSSFLGTIEVVEYDVASASDSENLFSSDSSSGAEDILISISATTLRQSSKLSSEFADSSDSDSEYTYDSELSSADYWMCVKCKNKNNNPLFRYCEKCYQIRKTHFPPRPRNRKRRPAVLEKRKSAVRLNPREHSIKSAAIGSPSKAKQTIPNKDDDTEKDVSALLASSGPPCLPNGSVSSHGRLQFGISQNQNKNSSSDEDEDTTNQFYNGASPSGTIVKTPNSKCFSSSELAKRLEDQKPQSSLKRKCESIPQQSKKLCSEKVNLRGSEIEICPISSQSLGVDLNGQSTSKVIMNRGDSLSQVKTAAASSSLSDSETEIGSIWSQSISASIPSTQKDSGFSSAPSSQETKYICDDYKDCADDQSDSSDTVCDDMNDSDVADMNGDNDYLNSIMGRPLNVRPSNITLESQEKPTTVLLRESLSECSDAYTNVQSSSNSTDLVKLAATNESNLNVPQVPTPMVVQSDPDMNGNGSCVTCLSQPKNGVFVHSKFLHLCCCYKCAVKIWNKNKKCPICNCAVKNVMKLFVY